MYNFGDKCYCGEPGELYVRADMDFRRTDQKTQGGTVIKTSGVEVDLKLCAKHAEVYYEHLRREDKRRKLREETRYRGKAWNWVTGI